MTTIHNKHSSETNNENELHQNKKINNNEQIEDEDKNESQCVVDLRNKFTTIMDKFNISFFVRRPLIALFNNYLIVIQMESSILTYFEQILAKLPILKDRANRLFKRIIFVNSLKYISTNDEKFLASVQSMDKVILWLNDKINEPFIDILLMSRLKCIKFYYKYLSSCIIDFDTFYDNVMLLQNYKFCYPHMSNNIIWFMFNLTHSFDESGKLLFNILSKYIKNANTGSPYCLNSLINKLSVINNIPLNTVSNITNISNSYNILRYMTKDFTFNYDDFELFCEHYITCLNIDQRLSTIDKKILIDMIMNKFDDTNFDTDNTNIKYATKDIFGEPIMLSHKNIPSEFHQFCDIFRTIPNAKYFYLNTNVSNIRF